MARSQRELSQEVGVKERHLQELQQQQQQQQVRREEFARELSKQRKEVEVGARSSKADAPARVSPAVNVNKPLTPEQKERVEGVLRRVEMFIMRHRSLQDSRKILRALALKAQHS